MCRTRSIWRECRRRGRAACNGHHGCRSEKVNVKMTSLAKSHRCLKPPLYVDALVPCRSARGCALSTNEDKALAMLGHISSLQAMVVNCSGMKSSFDSYFWMSEMLRSHTSSSPAPTQLTTPKAPLEAGCLCGVPTDGIRPHATPSFPKKPGNESKHIRTA